MKLSDFKLEKVEGVIDVGYTDPAYETVKIFITEEYAKWLEDNEDPSVYWKGYCRSC